MIILELAYLLTGVLCSVIFVSLFYSSIRELKFRAFLISGFVLVVFTLYWFGVFAIFKSPLIMTFSIAIVLSFILMFFLPAGRTISLQIGELTGRVDERDVIFSREEYQAGTTRYKNYYSSKPENKAIDDKLRQLPELLKPGSRYYDPIRSPFISSIFKLIRGLTNDVDGEVANIKHNFKPNDITIAIKEIVLDMGAVDVGIANLNPAYVYSHVGRGPEVWGTQINNNHRFVIVFALEMDCYRIEKAPRLPVTLETARQYLSSANISVILASFIRRMGYPARAHIAGSNYQILLPPVAYDAGLGELGRIGYIISPKFGARIRLGAVTTDLPLIVDKPITFGVQNFCEKCLKCAINCPSNAIPKDVKMNIRGIMKWQINTDKCLHYWRVIGTDCALCMKVCPYSHPHSFIHNIVRMGIRRTDFARTISLYGDNLLYGKKTNYSDYQ